MNPTQRTDHEILQAVLTGSHAAFAELIQRHRGVIYKCIVRVTGSYAHRLGSEDVDEIFAEVCLALWADGLRRLRVFDAGRGMKLSSWLGLLATHAAYDHLRRLRRRPQEEDLSCVPEDARGEPSALDGLIERERRSTLSTLAKELSRRDQEFVVRYFHAEEDPDRIAADFGIARGTVYTKTNKIKARLVRLARERALAA